VRQSRKGTDFPYVVHPIRVAEILDRFGYGKDVVMAGALHDTVEDASVSYSELTNEFGERVSELVEKASEPDKALDWRTPKQHTVARAASEDDLEALALVAADKLDNVRSLKETLRARGEEKTWTIFNADRRNQHWYYRTLAQALLDREPTNLLFRTLDAEVHALFLTSGARRGSSPGSHSATHRTRALTSPTQSSTGGRSTRRSN
jgi:(p)ppGpp synthase/HD superfamily hydrolase